MERLVKMTAIPLFLIGILLIYVSISIFNSTNDFKKTAVPVTAVISNISTYSRNDGEIGHNVFVDYKYADKIYEHVYINAYNSNMFVGKKINIYVNTAFPSEAKCFLSICFFSCRHGSYFTACRLRSCFHGQRQSKIKGNVKILYENLHKKILLKCLFYIFFYVCCWYLNIIKPLLEGLYFL